MVEMTRELQTRPNAKLKAVSVQTTEAVARPTRTEAVPFSAVSMPLSISDVREASIKYVHASEGMEKHTK